MNGESSSRSKEERGLKDDGEGVSEGAVGAVSGLKMGTVGVSSVCRSGGMSR